MVRFSTAFAAVAASLGLAEGSAGPRNLEAFIAKQTEISLAGVLANIGPDGSEVQGVPPGVLVASPSREDPDCAYLSVFNSLPPQR